MSLNLSTIACYQFILKNGGIIKGKINNYDEHFFEIKVKNPSSLLINPKPNDDIVYILKSEIEIFYKISEN